MLGHLGQVAALVPVEGAGAAAQGGALAVLEHQRQ